MKKKKSPPEELLVAVKDRLVSARVAMEEAKKLTLEFAEIDPDEWWTAADHSFEVYQVDEMEKKILARMNELKSLYPEKFEAIKEKQSETVDYTDEHVEIKYPAEVDAGQVEDDRG